DLVRSELKRLATPANVYTYYVDALALHGRDLVAVQNEVDPQRVVRFRLDDSGLVITSAEVLDAWDSLVPEPTLAALVGDRLYLVSNSQWRRFDENGKLPPPDQLQPPLIVSLSLP
ncbi:MAG TPA: hypothetical protein VLG68_09165, partial [Gammaproteobacteria bacterium]|nr:hypothetical protein [Gammaproteobacteria bacterium]